jgi:hypothetical protein
MATLNQYNQALGQASGGAQQPGNPYQSWYQDAFRDIMNWSVSPSQQNPNRGAQRDAFQMGAAMAGVNTQNSKELMNTAADLDLRNQQQIMGAEHGYNLAGMTHANELAKDYLQNETASAVRRQQEGGLQQRLLTQETGFQERQSQAEAGYQARATTRVQGQENRAQIRTQGDEARRLMTHDRDTAARMAVSQSRRA